MLEPHCLEQNRDTRTPVPKGVHKKKRAPKPEFIQPRRPLIPYGAFLKKAVSLAVVRDVHRDITEAEQVEKIADCRSIVRHIRIGRAHHWVGHIVPAAI